MAIEFQNAVTASSTSDASMTISRPAETVNGDFLVLSYSNNQAASTPTVAGWTPAITVRDTGQIDVLSSVFWKRANNEPASYTIDKGATYGLESVAIITRYKGVIAEGNPIRTTGSAVPEGRGGPSTGPTLDGLEPTDLVIHSFGGATGSWNSQPFQMEVADTSWNNRASLFGIGAASVAMLVVDQEGAAVGPTATHTGTGGTDSAARIGAIALIAEPVSVTPFRGWGIPAF